MKQGGRHAWKGELKLQLQLHSACAALSLCISLVCGLKLGLPVPISVLGSAGRHITLPGVGSLD